MHDEHFAFFAACQNPETQRVVMLDHAMIDHDCC